MAREAEPQGAEAGHRQAGRPGGFKTYPQAKRKLALAATLLQLEQLEREFCMTPASRAGIQVDEPYADEPSRTDYYYGTAWNV